MQSFGTGVENFSYQRSELVGEVDMLHHGVRWTSFNAPYNFLFSFVSKHSQKVSVFIAVLRAVLGQGHVCHNRRVDSAGVEIGGAKRARIMKIILRGEGTF